MTFVLPSSAILGEVSNARFSDLIKSIGTWLNRTDLERVIPDFVRMAESEFARDPRIRSASQVLRSVGPITSDQSSIPDDVQELVELRVGGVSFKQLALAEFRVSPLPHVFTRIGNVSQFKPGTTGNCELTYVQRIPNLTFSDDTNWLLSEHYDVYLWKCCEQGSVWLRDVEGATGYRSKYEAAVADMLAANNWREWGGAPMSVQASGVV